MINNVTFPIIDLLNNFFFVRNEFLGVKMNEMSKKKSWILSFSIVLI